MAFQARGNRPQDASSGSSSGSGSGSTATNTLHSSAYGTVYFPVTQGSLPSSSGIGLPRSGGRTHQGLDIFGPEGSPIVAAVGGTVTAVSSGGGLGGVTVTIKDDFGHIHYYAHMTTSSIGTVRKGDRINGGELIGFVGDTGNAKGTNPHLHYSINGGRSNLVDPWQFLQSGDIARADPSTGSGNAGHGHDHGNAGTVAQSTGQVNVPEGGSWFRGQDGSYYIAYRFFGNSNREGPSEVVYYRADGPPPSGTKLHSTGFFEEHKAGWHDGGTTHAFTGTPPGSSFQDLVDDLLMQWGLAGTDALQDKDVLAIVGLGMTRQISEAELANRLRRTGWFQSRTDDEREWDDLADAEKSKRIEDAAAKIASLHFTYVGEDLRLSGLDSDGDGIVTAAELRTGNADLYSWAERLASGQVSEAGLVNTYLKKLAEDNPNSPWMRNVRQEEQAQGQFDVDVSTAAGEVRDLYYQWGMEVSDRRAMEIGHNLAMNNMSIEDLEEELRNQAAGLYPHKPEHLATRQWAQPYMETYMNTLETHEVDLQDPFLQRGLTQGMNLADFRKELRNDDRWLETQGARTEMNDKVSALGQVMGF